MEIVANKIAERADRILKKAFPGSKVEWDPVVPDEKISGWIIWDGFENLDELDRQLSVARVLKAALEPEEWKSISAVFAMTAHELAVIHEGDGK